MIAGMQPWLLHDDQRGDGSKVANTANNKENFGSMDFYSAASSSFAGVSVPASGAVDEKTLKQ